MFVVFAVHLQGLGAGKCRRKLQPFSGSHMLRPTSSTEFTKFPQRTLQDYCQVQALLRDRADPNGRSRADVPLLMEAASAWFSKRWSQLYVMGRMDEFQHILI